jgi:hypothetical protein
MEQQFSLRVFKQNVWNVLRTGVPDGEGIIRFQNVQGIALERLRDASFQDELHRWRQELSRKEVVAFPFVVATLNTLCGLTPSEGERRNRVLAYTKQELHAARNSVREFSECPPDLIPNLELLADQSVLRADIVDLIRDVIWAIRTENVGRALASLTEAALRCSDDAFSPVT